LAVGKWLKGEILDRSWEKFDAYRWLLGGGLGFLIALFLLTLDFSARYLWMVFGSVLAIGYGSWLLNQLKASEQEELDMDKIRGFKLDTIQARRKRRRHLKTRKNL
jgi:hypothetical protein